MTEKQAEYQTTVCECETCLAHRAGKQESMKDRLKRFLEEAKTYGAELRREDGSVYRGKAEKPEANGESVKDYNRDQEGMPCDFCSHHVNSEPSFCVTCGPENSNYDGHEFEVEENAPPCIGCVFEAQEECLPVCSVCNARDRYENGHPAETPIFNIEDEQKPEPGKKFDQGKLRYDLLPGDVLEEITQVFTLGAEKYSARNWEQGMSWGRVFGAAMRHMWAFWTGKTTDDESGRPHLAHAIVNLMFLLAYQIRGVGTDDRRVG